jgi:glycerol-3-phosphate dehydrogenase (NAD(P)+)
MEGKHSTRPIFAMRARDLSTYHRRTRERGVNPIVYWIVRSVLEPFLRLYLRLDRVGREHIPASGPAILAANHRSFLDPWIVGICLRRPIHFVAKRELFEKRLNAWFLNALGAFPIRRGESDDEAMATARGILERGGVVVIFPEGTRIRSGSLGRPKRGVGRLALETGAPVVPVSVLGTEHVRRGWIIRPRRVRVRCGRPLAFGRVEGPSPEHAAEVTSRVWACVELQWEWLGGLPPLEKAAVLGTGSAASAVAALIEQAGLDVEIATRTRAEADSLAAARRSKGPRVATAAELEFAGFDLIVLAEPSDALPAAVAQIGAEVSDRAGIVVLAERCGSGPDPATWRYVADRVRGRAVAALAAGGNELSSGGSGVLACTDPVFGQQLAEALGRGGLELRSVPVPVEVAPDAPVAAAA